MHIKDLLIGEENFEQAMQTTIEPLLNDVCTEHYLPVKNGALHTKLYKNQNAKGVVVICHGYTEFIEKYLENIYMFYNLGYSVAMCEHRGHGFSHRMSDNIHKIHIDTFATYVQDFKSFTFYVKEQCPDMPLFLFAHSMGGCIGALYLGQNIKPYKAAVLSSPMLELRPKSMPSPLAITISKTMVLFGKGQNTPAPPKFEPNEHFENSGSLSKARFERNMALRIAEPKYQMVVGTVGWLSAALSAVNKAQRKAKHIHIPLLLINAGKDTVVKPGGQKTFIEKVPKGKYLSLENSKHEAFNADEETRELFWQEIASFFEEFA